MKRRWLAIALGGLIGVAGVAVLAPTVPARASDVSPERQGELLDMVGSVCANCHGPTLAGAVGPPLTPNALAGKDPGMLADTIVNGRPGTPMPPFSGLVDDDEARWLVEQLMEGLPDR
jgi:cytochrome c55X